QPTSLVIDTSTGNLLVAEQDKVTIIPKADIEANLLATRLPGAPRPQAVSFPLGGGGVARDRCSGDIYTSDALAGVVRRFDAKTQQVSIVFTGLQSPGQLLALYRRGVSCPDGLQLLLVETGLARIVLLTPAQNQLVPWAEEINSTDVAFLEGGTGFTGPLEPSAILLSELFDAIEPEAGEGGSGLSFFGVPGLYDNPNNEPTDGGTTPIIFADSGLESCARTALSLGPTQLVTQGAAETLTQLTCGPGQINSLEGLQSFPRLTELVVQDNIINRDEPLAGLNRLTKLDLRNNKFGPGRLTTVAGLVGLTELDLCGQLFETPFGEVPGISDLDFAVGLVNLQILRLCDNNVRTLTPLSGLVELQTLDLADNLISDLSPLVDNTGLGTGDTIDIRGNGNLDSADCADIATLTGRGATVQHDLSCP
ncbi:MAG: leucine-rich repeat domain-containing protein, partial [Acidobacteriota bacterium]